MGRVSSPPAPSDPQTGISVSDGHTGSLTGGVKSGGKRGMFHRFFFTVDHSRSSLKFRMPRVTRGRSEIGGGRGSGVSLLAGPCGGGCGPCAAGPGSVRGARGARGTPGSLRRGLGRSPRAVWNPEGRLSVKALGRALGIQPADPGPAAFPNPAAMAEDAEFSSCF